MDNDYRLQQIDKIHKKLEVEIAKREKLSANYRKGLKILNATEGVLAVSFLGLNTVSVVVLSTVVAVPTVPAIQAASLGAGLLFIIGGFVRRNLKQRAEKHEKIKLLVDERLNAINRFVSKAIDDDVVTDEEYSLVFTARCTLVQSAVLRSHVVCLSVCLSVCNVGEL